MRAAGEVIKLWPVFLWPDAGPCFEPCRPACPPGGTLQEHSGPADAYSYR
jgi:hypothetical protein